MIFSKTDRGPGNRGGRSAAPWLVPALSIPATFSHSALIFENDHATDRRADRRRRGWIYRLSLLKRSSLFAVAEQNFFDADRLSNVGGSI